MSRKEKGYTENGDTTEKVGPRATIQGHVRDDQNKGVPNVTIFNKNIFTDAGSTRRTNSGGYYRFDEDLDPKKTDTEYRVTVAIPSGYRCRTASTVTIKLNDGDEKDVDFTLVAETASGPKPAASPLTFVELKRIRGFQFDGRQIVEIRIDPTGKLPEQILVPPKTLADGMIFLDEAVRFVDEQTEEYNPLLAQFGNVQLPVLDKTPGRFRLLTPHQDMQFEFISQFFYQDEKRSYYVVPVVFFDLGSYWKAWFESGDRAKLDSSRFMRLAYVFQTFYHPHLKAFVEALNKDGVEGILARKTQQANVAEAFASRYEPDFGSDKSLVFPFGYPKEGVQFEAHEAYSLYNWELFFHAPFLIATHLSKNQRFAEAQRWFHYIFDPTDNSNDPNEPGRFWRTLPFYLAGQVKPVDELLKILADKTNLSEEKKQLEAQVAQWRKNPFQPHAIARWRPSAYQKAVVMKYLDNLIAWGDQLFRRDTIEALNEATQLYVLADQILGPRPERIPPRIKHQARTYKTLEPDLDAFSNALVQAENLISAPAQDQPPASPGSAPLPLPPTLYFCVPHNDKLLEYWDRVADRLFKIRHCMNIEGVVRQLPLFEPPIDPAMLVRAAAAGVDIGSVLSDQNAPLPAYRFNVMAQKASELCAEVKSLGAAMLATLEKRDAEALALLRSQNEIAALEVMRQVKEQAVQEARASITALAASLDMARTRLRYHCTLLSSIQTITLPPPSQQTLDERLQAAAQQLALDTSPPGTGQITAIVNARADELSQLARQSITAVIKTVEDLKSESLNELRDALSSLSLEPSGSQRLTLPISGFEKKQLDELKFANEKQKKAMNYESLAQLLALIPDFKVGFWTTLGTTIGGSLLSRFVSLQASQYQYEASDHSYQANLSSILGSYQRRTAEWQHQADLALKEIEQIYQQMQAACFRLGIAAQDLANHDRQIRQARDVDAAMREKYTNQELYNWMVGQISDIYFRSYQLAYEVAKRAERAFRFELGFQDSNFIQFGYWDSLKKGLLTGERLYQDLKRMEVAYLEQNRREYEITKHVSLARLDPVALIRLRQTGECYITISEVLFDLDFPGHYMRRIKSVSLTVPCVTGPYTGINCTLTLLKSSVRHNSLLQNDQHARDVQNDDPRFTDYYGSIQSIVTSSGQNDSGLFETNLRDERYLPFEGAGAISTWRLELPNDFRQFDYETISDVVLTFRYTARGGGDLLKQRALAELTEAVNQLTVENDEGLRRMFSLRHEFPTEWHRLTSAGLQEFVITKSRFPFLFGQKKITISKVELYVLPKSDPTNPTVTFPNLTIMLPDGTTPPLTGGTTIERLLAKTLIVGKEVKATEADAKWKFTIPTTDVAKIDDILMVCHYTVGEVS